MIESSFRRVTYILFASVIAGTSIAAAAGSGAAGSGATGPAGAGAGAMPGAGAPKFVADPETIRVLNLLHQTNLKEIEAGKLAEKKGQAKDVKSLGKMLIKDHTAADKKVTSLAKEEKVTLDPASYSMDDMATSAPASVFDANFAVAMVEEHQKVISEMDKVHEETPNTKLKKLLGDLVPIFRKHQDAAQKIVDTSQKNASK
jgi:putative membrane protein